MNAFKKIITILFLIGSSFLFSQEKNTIAITKNNKGDQPFFRIKPSNLFYIGVENPFVLYKDPSKKYTLTTKNGLIHATDTTSKDSCIYIVNVINTEPTFIYITVDGKTFTYKFRNRKIPSPSIVIFTGAERIKGGNVTAKDFSKAESAVLDLSDFDYNCGFSIINMEITKVSNGENKNYLLTDYKIGDITKHCAPGEIYILHNVVIEFSTTKDQRSINGTTFFIK